MALNLNTPIVAAACIALVCSIVFCLEISGYVREEDLGVRSGAMQSQPWRLITFMFTHDGIEHLLTNLVGLALVSILAFELVEMHSLVFLAVFVGVGILTVLPVVFLSAYIFVGASAGVMGLFGYVLMGFRRPGPWVLFILAMFISVLATEAWCAGSAVAATAAFVHVFALTVGAIAGRIQKIKKDV